MSYEPTNWKSGDVVTSAKLNKLEQGVANAGGVLIVSSTQEGVLNKTWQEIHDAMLTSLVAIVMSNGNAVMTMLVTGVEVSGSYKVVAGETLFIASSADDYPVYTDNGGGGSV